MNRKILSMLLAVFIFFSLLPTSVSFAASADKDERIVYLHAQGEKPQETVNTSVVYLGDTVDLYFAVDDPNKGSYVDGKHLEPQYDMNGYTVKIYFDPVFFDFAVTSKTAASTPIDYTVPDRKFASSGEGTENEETNLPTSVGYYVYSLGSGAETINGKTYKTGYATIFFSGNYVPQRETGALWYNLCVMPLTPLRTGSSDVFMEIGTADPHSLELFAKNVNDDYAPNFQFTAINGGYHHITIKDKLKPASPEANPVSGSYTEPQNVELLADPDCNIYYSLDGGNTYVMYERPIPVEQSCEIFAYAERKADGKKSNTVSFEYKIIPSPPVLFDSDKTQIPNVYTEDSAYTVYVSDKSVYDDIDPATEVYYTFGELTVEDWTDDGSSPTTQWVKIPKGQANQKINIDRKRTVRLLAVKSSAYSVEYSDIAWYYLGIKPAPVMADPDSGVYEEKKTVTLTTETRNAKIYYTTNGEDPRSAAGIEYTIPLVFNKDTSLRAAAFYDGEWSDISAYWYVFYLDDDYGVEAFYPSGVYEGEVRVTLTPNNPENTVQYSTDGGESWKPYTETIVLSENTEILAKAIDKNGTAGEIQKFTYTIRPLPPLFAPESTQFTNADKITIYCPERTDDNYTRYALYYTLDGSDPSTNPNALIAPDEPDSVEIQITDYTVVKAVVKRDDTTYSTVVSHSYDIVVSKPVAPITTLLPGFYTHEIGGDSYSTQFAPVPVGTTIYYTVAYGDEIKPDPVPGMPGTYVYNGDSIPVKGKTLIKAVAVNVFGAKSDIGIFEYTVTPEAPVAAPSAQVSGDLPVVPVQAVDGCIVTYTLGNFTNTFENTGFETFYVDTKTGEAYRDAECTDRLGEASSASNTGTVHLSIFATLDGVSSEPNRYVYTASSNPNVLAPPFADKITGTYPEINVDNQNNLLVVYLDSLNKDADIEYMEDNSGRWIAYTGEPLRLKKDTVLQLRAHKDGRYSAVANYVYEFSPLAPIITLPSGRYDKNPVPTTRLRLDIRVPTDIAYDIMYRANGDDSDVRYTGAEREIDHTMSFKAYVLNTKTGKKSKNTIHYYIIESSNEVFGSVYTAYPYEVNPGDTKYIGAHLLSQADYNKGIKLYTRKADAKIRYFYGYTKADGSGTAVTETFTYDNELPIFVNTSMADLQITAWLIDKDGNEIIDSQSTFNYVFVDLKIPVTSLEASGKVEVPKNTKYTIINDYPNDPHTMLYYTLDGSDPTEVHNAKRKKYDGETLSVTEAVTVRTVYFRACGKCGACRDDNFAGCTNGVYGEAGKYNYTVPKSTGGGGGGGGGGTTTIDRTRKYTVDIFGTEHPTHIGYIKGYPDGSVQPDGNITREEMTAILHRISPKIYEEPFVFDGDLFPDVEKNRWSAQDIEYMADNGIVQGYPDGEFKPANPLTRAEFAALIRRFIGAEDSIIPNNFPDLQSSHWAYKDILTLCDIGLMQGYEDGTFRPQRAITRAEVMTVINKILGRNPDEEYVKSLHFNPYNDLEEQKWYYVIVLEATITHDYFLNKSSVEYEWENWK